MGAEEQRVVLKRVMTMSLVGVAACCVLLRSAKRAVVVAAVV